jgi:hypothetical protein
VAASIERESGGGLLGFRWGHPESPGARRPETRQNMLGFRCWLAGGGGEGEVWSRGWRRGTKRGDERERDQEASDRAFY